MFKEMMKDTGKKIVTVLGEIPAESLGFCQSHEHLSVDNDWVRAKFPALVIDDPARSLLELQAYREAGGAALVDAQPVGAGRNGEVLRRLAEASGVQIIASTGFHRMVYYPLGHWIYHWDRERLVELFVEELTRGIYLNGDGKKPCGRSTARAGQIKAALEPGALDAQHHKLFSAVAEASVATGAPVMVHIEKDAEPLALSDFLAERGVPPHKQIFCHMDRAIADLSVHVEALRRGLFLEYDTIARFKYHDDEQELAILRHMAGYSAQILASLDVTRERLLSYGGKPGLAYILTDFVPRMRQAGFSKRDIEQIFKINPAQAFSRSI